MNPEEKISARTVAKILGISTYTVRAIAEGEFIPYEKKEQRRDLLFFNINDVEEWVKKNGNEAAKMAKIKALREKLAKRYPQEIIVDKKGF
jgi:hypothetical protein